jgi:hypothetical protein
MSNPWIIDEADFYELETHQEQMAFLLRYAILAPSGHNTQPWSFRIAAGGVEVMADYSRRLPVVDKHDRELLMSVGAAIANFRVAAAHFGFDTTVTYEPRPLETLPVAMVQVCETCAPDESLAALFPAIRKRHTNRELFDGQSLDPEVLQAILNLVDANPATLRLLLPRDTERVVEALASAERTLMARPAYRAELADSPLPIEALGIPSVLSGVTPWLIRTFDVGDLQARRDSERIRSASMLVVLTAGDDRVSLLKAGEALEILLLTITAAGLQYSFLNAAVEVEESREHLRMLIGSTHPPQVLLRIGSAAIAPHPTPRRPVSAVLA